MMLRNWPSIPGLLCFDCECIYTFAKCFSVSTKMSGWAYLWFCPLPSLLLVALNASIFFFLPASNITESPVQFLSLTSNFLLILLSFCS